MFRLQQHCSLIFIVLLNISADTLSKKLCSLLTSTADFVEHVKESQQMSERDESKGHVKDINSSFTLLQLFKEKLMAKFD